MPKYYFPRGKKKPLITLLLLIGLILLGLLVAQIPTAKSRLTWRLITGEAYLRGMVDPVKSLPTAVLPPGKSERIPSDKPTPLLAPSTPAVQSSPTPQPSSTALPVKVELESPPYE